MPKKKPKGAMAKPPRRPPTAIGTIPPGGASGEEAAPAQPSPPINRKVVAVVGADGVGKSTVALNLAVAWAGSQTRKVIVCRISSMKSKASDQEPNISRVDIAKALGVSSPPLTELWDLMARIPKNVGEITVSDVEAVRLEVERCLPFSRWGVAVFPALYLLTESRAESFPRPKVLLMLLSWSYDLILELDEEEDGNEWFLSDSNLVLWAARAESLESGSAAEKIQRYRNGPRNLPPVEAVVNETDAGPREDIMAALRGRKNSPLAFFPYDSRFPDFAKSGKIAVVEDVQCDWVRELPKLLRRVAEAGWPGSTVGKGSYLQHLMRYGRETVLSSGFASEESISIALSKQLGIPYASFENKILKMEKGQNLEALISESFARENFVIPLFLEQKVLAVAIADPSNAVLLEEIRSMTGCELRIFIAAKTQIKKAIDVYYSVGGSEKAQEKFTPFSYINEENVKRLAYMFMLRKEEPWVMAVVISYLRPDYAKALLASLPLEMQAKLALAALTVRQVTREQVIAIEDDVRESVEFVVGDMERLTTMLDAADAATRATVLDYLKHEKPNIYELVRRFILTFDDLAGFPNRDMMIIARELKTEVMARALQNAPFELVNKFLHNMTAGGAAYLKEFVEGLRGLTPAEIGDAREKILEEVKRLEKEGLISGRERPQRGIDLSELQDDDE